MKNIAWAVPDIGEEEIEAVKDAVASTWIGGNGPAVAEFENFVARKIGVKHAIAVNNGTSALLCALQAFREKLGALHVLVPTFTYLATANTAYEVANKNVILADCNRETWNVDKRVINEALSLSPSTNLIMPVDVAGLPVDYDVLKKLKLPMLADSAGAIGSRYKGELLGSQADVHIFSLHAAKTITAGEGGVITTNDTELYDIMKSISNQGYPTSVPNKWDYHYERIGFNYRITNLQAALALVQIKKLDEYVKARIERAKIYEDILGDIIGYQENVLRDTTHSYFIFGILTETHKQQLVFCEEMHRKGIDVKVTWIPAHKLPFYTHLAKNTTYPNSEWLWHHIISLPIHNVMSQEDTIYVAETARDVLRKC